MPILDPAGTGECEFRVIVERIRDASALPDVQQDPFRRQQSKQKPRRNVVWVPLSGEPLDQVTELRSQRVSAALRVEWLLEEWLIVEARITGVGSKDADGFEDAERIRRNVVAAFVKVTRELGRKSEVGGHQWLTQQEGAAADALGGAETVIQQFRFRVPIPKSTQSTTTITAATHTCTVDDSLPNP
ncbi:MAG: hypothetical protein ACWGPR_08560 [Candidatus Deferrimicrobiaceae bacterium]